METSLFEHKRIKRNESNLGKKKKLRKRLKDYYLHKVRENSLRRDKKWREVSEEGFISDSFYIGSRFTPSWIIYELNCF